MDQPTNEPRETAFGGEVHELVFKQPEANISIAKLIKKLRKDGRERELEQRRLAFLSRYLRGIRPNHYPY